MSDRLALLRCALGFPRVVRDQWLAPEAVVALQQRRLKALVRHAFDRSAFYRQRFAAAGLEPEDIRSADDLSALPPTTREDLRDSAALVAEGCDSERLRTSTTSGSTGRRTTSRFDPAGWLISKHLLKLRARLACGVRPTDRIALIQEEPGRAHGAAAFGRMRWFSIHQPLDALVAELAPFAPTVLYGFPGHLRRLGEVARGRLRPRLVFTSGELMDEATRQGIEDTLGATVLDVYGCTETKEIAWECPAHEGYHLNADWIVLEAPGSDDHSTGPGGTILVTPLFNFGMPLIRYEIGDTGELLTHRCSCRRGLPLIRPTLGRSVDYLRLANGSLVAPYSLTCAIEMIDGMRQYQIAQTARDRVEVRVVPSGAFDESSRLGIETALQPVLHGLRPDVVVVDDIPPEPSGKFRIVKSEMTSDAFRGPGPGA